MEVSNKTFGIFCVAVVGVSIYVRAQSLHTPAALPAPVVTQAVAEKPKIHRPIPNSTLPPDLTASTNTQVVADGEPGVVEPETSPTQPITPQTDSSSNAANSGEDDLTYQDDLGDLAGPEADVETPPANNGWQLSDRDTLRLMMRTMPEQQRDEFRVMWYSLTPDERGDVLDQIRGTQQGG